MSKISTVALVLLLLVGVAWAATGLTGQTLGQLLHANLFFYNGTSHETARGDTTNGLDVDVTRVSGDVSIDDQGGLLTSYTLLFNSVTGDLSDPQIVIPAQGSGKVFCIDSGYIKCSDDDIGGVINGADGTSIFPFTQIANDVGFRTPTWAGLANSPYCGIANSAIQIDFDSDPSNCDAVLGGKVVTP